eukprot:m.75918 g.75918  ORF g.75918 m.75918 type:complete len:97 (+) comp12463_c0_seq2:608-898(+)
MFSQSTKAIVSCNKNEQPYIKSERASLSMQARCQGVHRQHIQRRSNHSLLQAHTHNALGTGPLSPYTQRTNRVSAGCCLLLRDAWLLPCECGAHIG